MRKLPIRAHLALLCAVTVAAAIVTASVLAWLATRHTLRDQVDASLDQRGGRSVVISAAPLGSSPFERLCDLPVPEGGGAGPLGQVQLLRSDGSSCFSGDAGDRIEPLSQEYAVARGDATEILRDATTADGEHVRALTVPAGPGYAMTVTRSLAEVDAALRELAMILTLAAALGVVVAAGSGLVVARVVLRPVDRLTAAAEHVAKTEDLDVPIEVPAGAHSGDEVARLSVAFNAMTSRLAGSRRRQRQLIADAGHELRTPLTSLRTNIEWLMRADDRGRPLNPREKRQVEQAVLGQIDELSTLIGEVAALARDEPVGRFVPLDLDQVVLRAVDRAQRRDPSRRFDLRLETWPVLGDQVGLERAVLNLLDNALKFSEGPIAVSLEKGRLAVTDRGPGLPETERAQAFDRFWRAPTARELPGSGLGLAIVADCALRHGGEVFFGSAAGGGAEVGFRLPPPPPGSVSTA